ncbi:NADH dehydrogenase [Achromatium sp. WMS3]|nr:NADH dehydrogenase [Achromatium sp. WMS3]
MEFFFQPLNWLTFLPLLGMLAILSIDTANKDKIRWIALVTTIVTFVISLWILVLFDAQDPNLQLEARYSWLQLAGLQVEYHLAIDGLSILLVLLTTFLAPLCVLSTWTAITEQVKTFMVLFLLLEVNMLGVFLAQDLFLFYVFWELSLVPMYFIIALWGGPKRGYAALKLFLYTMAGSILMLVGIIFLGTKTGTLDLPTMQERLPELYQTGIITWNVQLLLFLAFVIAFAIKVPMWPVHSWLPDAHTEAPTAGSVILAGVLLKMGTYGFLRFVLPVFPLVSLQAAPWFALLATIGILYGAWVSYAQQDIKRLVAYSSVSHLGFVMLGLFALNTQGITGAILQMINHGISTSALFLLIGILYEQTHTRDIKVYGGLWRLTPWLGTITLISVLSSMGLPGLNGFIGEFIILLGAFGSEAIGSPWYAGFAAIGVIMAAIYLLYMFQGVFLGADGEITKQYTLRDINQRELIIMIPLVILMFWIGLYPQPFFDILAPAVSKLVATIPL